MSQFLSQQKASYATKENIISAGSFSNQVNSNQNFLINSLNSTKQPLQQNQQSLHEIMLSKYNQQQKRNRNLSANDLHLGSKGNNNGQKSKDQGNSMKIHAALTPNHVQAKAVLNQQNQNSREDQCKKKSNTIQKAIDNLKSFINGSYPKGTVLQSQSKMNNSKYPIANQYPRKKLTHSFINQSQSRKQNPNTEYDMLDDNKRKNPHEPIPAFTSIEIAKKLRYRSEDRYVNQRMEQELIAYKREIEKRYQKSDMKDFVFPRTQDNQTPMFFSNQQRDQSPITPINELSSAYYKQQHYKPRYQQTVQNKENINSDLKQDIHKKESDTSPYTTKNSKSNGTYTITDYKKALSQFLNTSGSKTSKHAQRVKNSGQQLNTSSHQRSCSSGLLNSCTMLSQKVLANAKQTLEDHLKKVPVHKKHTSTFVETVNDSKILVTDDIFEKDFNNTDEEYVPVLSEEFSGIEELQTPGNNTLSGNFMMKTFDLSRPINLDTQQSNCNYNDKMAIVNKRQMTQQNDDYHYTQQQSNQFKNLVSDYYKTFYNQQQHNKVNKSLNSKTSITNQQRQAEDIKTSVITANQCPSTQVNINKKQRQPNKSISKIQEPAISTISSINNPFHMQISLKALQEQGKVSNNKTSSRNGMHSRAKTASDFNIGMSSKLLQEKASMLVQNDQQRISQLNPDTQIIQQVYSSKPKVSDQKSSFISKHSRHDSYLNKDRNKCSTNNKISDPTKSIISNNQRVKNYQQIHNSDTNCQTQMKYGTREQLRHHHRTNASICNLPFKISQDSLTRSSNPQCYKTQLTEGSTTPAVASRVNQMYVSFTNKQNTSTTNTGRKIASDKVLGKSDSKRDFKVKCMKIDLSKQIVYCSTEHQ